MHWPSVGLNVFETIAARRSVRDYRPGSLDRQTLRTLLEAAVHAPTAVHQEPWAFAIVQDRQLLQLLSDRAKPLFAEELWRAGVDSNNHAFDILAAADSSIFHNAGTLIVICAKPAGLFVSADCWLAAENLLLAACAMGLGSCVVGSALPALRLEEMKARLGIPADYTAIAPIVVGHPRVTSRATKRREPFVLAWRDGDQADAKAPADVSARGAESGELLRLRDEGCRLRSLLARMVEELPPDHELVHEAHFLL